MPATARQPTPHSAPDTGGSVPTFLYVFFPVKTLQIPENIHIFVRHDPVQAIINLIKH